MTTFEGIRRGAEDRAHDPDRMQDLLVRLRPCRGRHRVADSAGHAVHPAAAALDLPQLLGDQRPVPGAARTDMKSKMRLARSVGRGSRPRFPPAAARMQGLDSSTPALAVEAVGFAPWDEHWLGVMLTPWFMNLVLLPRNPGGWQPLATGAKRRYAFPAGEYEFVGANDAMLGAYQVCSLFSPVHRIRGPGDGAARRARSRGRRCSTRRTRRRGRVPTANLSPAAVRPPNRARSRNSSRRSTPRCRSATSCAGASSAPTVTHRG